jgi:predicted Zn-dependent protease
MRVCISSCLTAKNAPITILRTPLADKIGLKLSAKACFDPAAAPSCGSRLGFCSVMLTLARHRMFKRLGALEKSCGGLNVSFLNTHPASDERVKVCTSHYGLVMYHSLI